MDFVTEKDKSLQIVCKFRQKRADKRLCDTSKQTFSYLKATISRGVFNHSRGCSFCNIKSAALCRRLLYINLSHQKRLNLFAFQRRLDSGWNHLDLCDERSRFFYRIVLSERYEIDVPRVH